MSSFQGEPVEMPSARRHKSLFGTLAYLTPVPHELPVSALPGPIQQKSSPSLKKKSVDRLLLSMGGPSEIKSFSEPLKAPLPLGLPRRLQLRHRADVPAVRLHHRALRLARRVLRDGQPGHAVVRLLVAAGLRLAGAAPEDHGQRAALHPEQRGQHHYRGQGGPTSARPAMAIPFSTFSLGCLSVPNMYLLVPGRVCGCRGGA